MLEFRNTKLATVEAKAWDKGLTEGVGQAKDYAGKLELRFAYSTNGQGIYGIDMDTGEEGELAKFPTPDELWNLTFVTRNAWRDRFAKVPFEDRGGYFQGRYYQDIAIVRVLEAIVEHKQRILLTFPRLSAVTNAAQAGKRESVARGQMGWGRFERIPLSQAACCE